MMGAREDGANAAIGAGIVLGVLTVGLILLWRMFATVPEAAAQVPQVFIQGLFGTAAVVALLAVFIGGFGLYLVVFGGEGGGDVQED